MPIETVRSNYARKINFENLDGLRFLCFLSVFFFHSFHTEYDEIKNSGLYDAIKWHLFGNGNLGVNFFFVLSGFLITYLLIEERKLNGQIDLKSFWIRRVLRIWPLFYMCVFFGFFVFPALKSFFGESPNETATIYYYLSFSNNFEFIDKGPPDASILGVLWSVAVEEQFYVIWPIVLYVLPVRKYWIAFISVVLIGIAFRLKFDSPAMHEYHTLSCISDMAVGAFGAWLVLEMPGFKTRIVNLNKVVIASAYLLFFLVFFFRDEVLNSFSWVRSFERVLISVIMLAIILEQNYAAKSFFKMSTFKTFSKLGVITYGLYCLHFVGILMATTITKKLGINTDLWQVLILDTSLALGFTIILAKLSFDLYEKRFLLLKQKFAYVGR